jgi:hypothetical protein
LAEGYRGEELMGKDKSITWLQERTTEYRAGKDGISELVEDFDDVGKLGQGFLVVDELQEVNLGEGNILRPTYISANLPQEQKEQMCNILKEFMDCFTF